MIALLVAALVLMLTGCGKGWFQNSSITVNGETVVGTAESKD